MHKALANSMANSMASMPPRMAVVWVQILQSSFQEKNFS